MEAKILRLPLIVANWKMNKIKEETNEYIKELLPLLENYQKVEILICPPFTSLEKAAQGLASSSIKLGAQNVFWEVKGSFTGEISAEMLVDLGCEYVLLGHSERRNILGESDVVINKKLLATINDSLIPLLCVGETLQERNNKLARDVVKKQLHEALQHASIDQLEKSTLVIAYEPVWAIGTGVNASSDDAEEMIMFIREILADLYHIDFANKTRILYGGSVNPDNINNFMEKKNIDGALVGGASLQADTFAKIVRFDNNG